MNEYKLTFHICNVVEFDWGEKRVTLHNAYLGLSEGRETEGRRRTVNGRERKAA